MALGCPVIAFARGVLPELVVHETTGFLVQDLNEMVQYIPRIDTLDRLKTHAHVARHFSARAMTHKYVDISMLVFS